MPGQELCTPIVTDEELPGGQPCMIYLEDDRVFMMYNRGALLADPEAVVREMAEHACAVVAHNRRAQRLEAAC